MSHWHKTLPFSSKLAIRRIADWFTLLNTYEGGKELLGKIVDHVAQKCPEVADVKGKYYLLRSSMEVAKNVSDNAVEELDKLLHPLFQTADIMWQEKWKAAYDKIIVGDRTLESCCLALDQAIGSKDLWRHPFSIKELAGTLGLTYQQAYKIAPLLIEEGYNIQYRAKEN